MNSVNKLLLTQAEFAARRGVKPSAVSNWKSKGLLVFAEDPEQPGKLKVDVLLTEARLASKVDPTRGRPTTAQAQGAQLPLLGGAAAPDPKLPVQGASLADARGELIREQTISRRMANDAEARRLVALVEYERRSADVGRLARDRMHSILRTYADRLAAIREPRELITFFAAEIDRAFEDLADAVASGALSADDDEPAPDEVADATDDEITVNAAGADDEEDG